MTIFAAKTEPLAYRVELPDDTLLVHLVDGWSLSAPLE